VRSVDNLARLHRTLTTSGSDVGRLVKKLVVSCVVLFADLTPFEQCLRQIIASCPDLSHLVIHPSFHPVFINLRPWTPLSFQEHTEVKLRSVCAFDKILNITRLDFGSSLLLSDLVSLLPFCLRLESLRFYLRNEDSPGHPGSEEALNTSLELSNLRELLYIRSDSLVPMGANTYVDNTLGSRWSLPLLRRFTYVFMDGSAWADICGFCGFNGRFLRYLHLGPDWRSWIIRFGTTVQESLQEIFDECPVLEHLVLWISGAPGILYSLSHTTIMWIDLWMEISKVMEDPHTIVQVNPPGLTSLRRIRVFDSRLCHPRSLDLPILLAPEIVPPTEGTDHTYMGLHIKQTEYLVFQMDSTVNYPIGDDDEELDGSDFDPDPIVPYDTSDVEDMSDDGDTSSSFSGGDSDVEVGGKIGEWQPNPELALAAFMSILQS
jgi:hypothetical protein